MALEVFLKDAGANESIFHKRKKFRHAEIYKCE